MLALRQLPVKRHKHEPASHDPTSLNESAPADDGAVAEHRSWWSRWWKRLLIIFTSMTFLLILVFILVGQRIVGYFAHGIVVDLADDYLTVPVSIEDIEVRFLPPAVTVRGLELGAPEVFQGR